MVFRTLFFTFPRPLTTEEEDIFIGHILAVRDSQVLNKIPALKASAELQAKIPFNPSKAMLEGIAVQCGMIQAHINEYFKLEPVSGVAGKYALSLSETLNIRGVDKVKNLLEALSSKKWSNNLLEEVKTGSVEIGSV